MATTGVEQFYPDYKIIGPTYAVAKSYICHPFPFSHSHHSHLARLFSSSLFPVALFVKQCTDSLSCIDTVSVTTDSLYTAFCFTFDQKL